MSIWFSISGALSCVLSSVVLVPDCINAVQTNSVHMSTSFLFLKGLVLANNVQYSVAIGMAYGWYAGLYVSISTTLSGICLCVLCYVKNQKDPYIELP